MTDENYTNKCIGARIRAARQAAGYKSAQDFCKDHNIPYQTHSQHVRGVRRPTESYFKKYSQSLKVNSDWLKTGEGIPFTKEKFNRPLKQQFKVLEAEKSLTKAIAKKGEPIHKELLTEILIALQAFDEPLLTPTELANSATEIYSDITSAEDAPELQLKMLGPIVSAYKRLYTNK